MLLVPKLADAGTIAREAVARLVALPGNPEGSRKLTFTQDGTTCPFRIRRVYWLHDLEEGEVRGSHAHRTLLQSITAVSGACDIELDNGEVRCVHRLQRATQALLVPPMLWRTITVLQPHTALVVLASAPFDEADYIRDYDAFLRNRRAPLPRPG